METQLLSARFTRAVAACVFGVAMAGLGGAGAAGAGVIVPKVMDGIAPPQSAVELNQGDKIYTFLFGTDYSQECTLGYIAPDASYAYTAGHCLFDDSDSAIFNAAGVPVGWVAFADRSAIAGGGQRDYLRIDLFDGVRGISKYSGDTVLGAKGLKTGDQVCSYGAGSNEIDCGNIAQVTGNIVKVSDMDSLPGDSGGPVWVPGKGFAGVIAGNQTLSSYAAFDLSSSHRPTEASHYIIFDTVS